MITTDQATQETSFVTLGTLQSTIVPTQSSGSSLGRKDDKVTALQSWALANRRGKNENLIGCLLKSFGSISSASTSRLRDRVSIVKALTNSPSRCYNVVMSQ